MVAVKGVAGTLQAVIGVEIVNVRMIGLFRETYQRQKYIYMLCASQ